MKLSKSFDLVSIGLLNWKKMELSEKNSGLISSNLKCKKQYLRRNHA